MRLHTAMKAHRHPAIPCVGRTALLARHGTLRVITTHGLQMGPKALPQGKAGDAWWQSLMHRQKVQSNVEESHALMAAERSAAAAVLATVAAAAHASQAAVAAAAVTSVPNGRTQLLVDDAAMVMDPPVQQAAPFLDLGGAWQHITGNGAAGDAGVLGGLVDDIHGASDVVMVRVHELIAGALNPAVLREPLDPVLETLTQGLDQVVNTYQHAVEGIHSTAESLISSMTEAWHLPVHAVQLPSYVASTIGMLLLLWLGGWKPTTSTSATNAANTTKTNSATPAVPAVQVPLYRPNPWRMTPTMPEEQQGRPAPTPTPTPAVVAASSPLGTPARVPAVPAAATTWGAAPGGRVTRAPAGSLNNIVSAAPLSSSASSAGSGGMPGTGSSSPRLYSPAMRSLVPAGVSSPVTAATTTKSTPLGAAVPVGAAQWASTAATPRDQPSSGGSGGGGAWNKLRNVLAPGVVEAEERAAAAAQRAREATAAAELTQRTRAMQADLKARLVLVCAALGPLSALMPGGEGVRPQGDALLMQLEASAATALPQQTAGSVGLSGLQSSAMTGEWVVSYATTSGQAAAPDAPPGSQSGLLGYLIHLLASLPGWGLDSVRQQLAPDPNDNGAQAKGRLHVVNAATFRLGPLGVWKVELHGTWEAQAASRDGAAAAAASGVGVGAVVSQTFDSLMVRPLSILGQSTTALPPVCVELPPQLRNVSEWRTTYLDADTRITRGPADVVFFLTRAPAAAANTIANNSTLSPPLQAATSTRSQPNIIAPQWGYTTTVPATAVL